MKYCHQQVNLLRANSWWMWTAQITTQHVLGTSFVLVVRLHHSHGFLALGAISLVNVPRALFSQLKHNLLFDVHVFHGLCKHFILFSQLALHPRRPILRQIHTIVRRKCCVRHHLLSHELPSSCHMIFPQIVSKFHKIFKPHEKVIPVPTSKESPFLMGISNKRDLESKSFPSQAL